MRSAAAVRRKVFPFALLLAALLLAALLLAALLYSLLSAYLNIGKAKIVN